MNIIVLISTWSFQTFQSTVETRIPHIIDLHQKGQKVLEASEAQECVVIEEELTELQQYCREVLCRLDKYHKKLLNAMVSWKYGIRVESYGGLPWSISTAHPQLENTVLGQGCANFITGG